MSYHLTPPATSKARVFSCSSLKSVYRSLAYCHRAGTHREILGALQGLRDGARVATVGGWLIFAVESP